MADAPLRSAANLPGAMTPRRISAVLIWLAGIVVLAAAARTAVLYLFSTSFDPWRGAAGLPRTDLAVALGILALGAAATALSYVVGSRSGRAAAGLGFATLIGLRLIAIIAFDARLVSDYSAYFSIARGMLAGLGFWTSVPPGYPFLEMLAIAVVGPTVAAGEVLNLVLSIAAGAAVYVLTRRAWGDRSAAVALMAFAIMPSQVLFTLVLGTEVPFAAALVVVAVIAVAAARSGRLAIVAPCGLVIGLAQYIRPTSQALVPVVALVLLLAAASWRVWLRQVAVLGLVFAITVAPIVTWNVTVNHRFSASASLSDEWSIYIGLNLPSTGRYSRTVRAAVSAAAGIPLVPENEGVPGARFSAERIAHVRVFNEKAGELVPDRIRTNGIRSLTFQPAKFAVMWQNADYPVALVFGPGSDQANERVAAVAALTSQAAWILVLVGASVGLWRARRGPPPEAVLLVLIVLSAVAVHALAEVQPRYHEYYVPLICVLAGAAVAAPRRIPGGRDRPHGSGPAHRLIGVRRRRPAGGSARRIVKPAPSAECYRSVNAQFVGWARLTAVSAGPTRMRI